MYFTKYKPSANLIAVHSQYLFHEDMVCCSFGRWGLDTCLL